MNSNCRPYRLHLFTVRLWQEVVEGKRWEWRGEIKNTASGELRYFRDFHALVHLLPMLLVESIDDPVSAQYGTHAPLDSEQERTMTTATPTLQEGVHAANRAFEAAFNAGDAAGAAAVYTADGQALPPNGATVSGRDALRDFWQAVMDMGVKRATLETVELQPCGEIAYEVGQATLYGEGDTVLDTAKFIVIWQQEDGQWKWRRDIWNSNTPA